MTLGPDFKCADILVAFINEQGRAKGFTLTSMHGSVSSKTMFDNFFKALGDVEPQGEC